MLKNSIFCEIIVIILIIIILIFCIIMDKMLFNIFFFMKRETFLLNKRFIHDFKISERAVVLCCVNGQVKQLVM